MADSSKKHLKNPRNGFLLCNEQWDPNSATHDFDDATCLDCISLAKEIASERSLTPQEIYWACRWDGPTARREAA
jgi:hypothetical protein